jgi:hypothetical protein
VAIDQAAADPISGRPGEPSLDALNLAIWTEIETIHAAQRRLYQERERNSEEKKEIKQVLEPKEEKKAKPEQQDQPETDDETQ